MHLFWIDLCIPTFSAGDGRWWCLPYPLLTSCMGEFLRPGNHFSPPHEFPCTVLVRRECRPSKTGMTRMCERWRACKPGMRAFCSPFALLQIKMRTFSKSFSVSGSPVTHRVSRSRKKSSILGSLECQSRSETGSDFQSLKQSIHLTTFFGIFCIF